MKKNYFLKLTLGVLVFAGTTGVKGQSLADVLTNLNANSTNITALVPNMYTFNYDAANIISDGGNDMYDGGNRLNTNIAPNIPYSDNSIIPENSFGPTGQYFTRHLPGLFVMVADIDNITSFSISGNNGADNQGTVDDYTFSFTDSCLTYNVFIKRVYNAGDPSINHVMIVPADAGISHTFAPNTDNDQHDILGLNNSTRIYYMLFASASGGFVNNATMDQIVAEFYASVVTPAIGPTGPPVVVATAMANDTICDGESVTLIGTGSPATYTWDNGVVDNVPFNPAVGTILYTVTAISNGCISTDVITVVVNDLPVISSTIQDEMLGNDGSIDITIMLGMAPYTFDWDNDGIGDDDDTEDLSGLSAGIYNVIVTDPIGCSSMGSFTVDSQLGIEDKTVELTIYPNPTNGELTVTINGNFDYQLVNMIGEVVLTGNAVDSQKLDLSTLTNGVYFVKVNANGNAQTIKVVKH